MPRIEYRRWNPNAQRSEMADFAAAFLRDYARQGYDMTVRQLYYRFVAAGKIPNTERSYQNLITLIDDARMAGVIDWGTIVDRTRTAVSRGHWDSVQEIVQSTADAYSVDLWEDQPRRVEVWVEKEALAGIVSRAAMNWDITYFSCRGYVSQSAMWRAARRVMEHWRNQQAVTILYLGDHDPSGIDMPRDVERRLRHFTTVDWARERERYSSQAAMDAAPDTIEEAVRDWIGLGSGDDEAPLIVERIALNMDQVRQYNPPPNPAKLTDSRASSYIAEHGYQSWELDALEPRVLDTLIQDRVHEIVDRRAYDAAEERQQDGQRQIRTVTDRWDDVVRWIDEGEEDY